MNLCAVITTINAPTPSVRQLAAKMSGLEGCQIVVVGDSKGPSCFELPECFIDGPEIVFMSLDEQLGGSFRLGKILPTKHYSRKNVGYLCAIASRAECIYETDDDNAPLGTWKPRAEFLPNPTILSVNATAVPAWVNVYRHFTDEWIWPRGIPLDHIRMPLTTTGGQRSRITGAVFGTNALVRAPIQQGLVNGSPDVDAIWRLTQDREFAFRNEPSVLLPPGNWCPFNTQSTWWWPIVYPLLYIPSHCSFRMCDIWKSFVAQRCLWELGLGVVFHSPEMYQDRNVHKLMTDFEDEVPGYLLNHRIAEILDRNSLSADPTRMSDNLIQCYEALVRERIFPIDELNLLETWVQDLAQCT